MDFLTHNRNLLLTLVIIVLLVALLMNGMSAPTAVSILLSGVTLAALYFLVASGISIIFGLMDVLNFAHGSFFMLGAYLGWTFYTNPRLILNTAPLLLALTAAVSLNSLLTRRVTVPAVGRWIAALLAVIIVVLGMRNFPIENLVAMGSFSSLVLRSTLPLPRTTGTTACPR
jgi:branched-chain amino acid transport system permease protein